MRAAWLWAPLVLVTVVACEKKAAPPPGRSGPAATESVPAPAAADVAAPVLPGPAAPPTPEPPPDLVPEADDPWLSWVDGAVLVTDPSGERPGREGEAVAPGALIGVEPGGGAEVDLPDGSVVDLDEATELLVHTVRREGALRQVELAVLGGGVRVIAASTEEAGSLFRVTTPVGVAEVQGTELAVDVDPLSGTARVVVLDGKAVLQTAAAREELAAPGGAAAGMEMLAGGEIRPVESVADLADRWSWWTERQADVLLERHGVDLAAPEAIAGTGLSSAAHPAWRASLDLRRRRVVSRARALAEAMGSEALGSTPGVTARLMAGRTAWGSKAASRPAADDGGSRRRAERWAARASQRAERRAALAETLVELRRVYDEHRAAAP